MWWITMETAVHHLLSISGILHGSEQHKSIVSVLWPFNFHNVTKLAKLKTQHIFAGPRSKPTNPQTLVWNSSAKTKLRNCTSNRFTFHFLLGKASHIHSKEMNKSVAHSRAWVLDFHIQHKPKIVKQTC